MTVRSYRVPPGTHSQVLLSRLIDIPSRRMRQVAGTYQIRALSPLVLRQKLEMFQSRESGTLVLVMAHEVGRLSETQAVPEMVRTQALSMLHFMVFNQGL